jgi:murein DD-endopeptidase MepM/ murein hydrolase activator NlpD
MDDCYLTASYKHPAYKAQWGFTHWGWDLGNVNKTTPVLAVADGIVIKIGLDNVVGNVIIARYNGITDNDGNTYDVIVRCMHLSAIMVKEGDTIRRGQVIGRMGNTGTVTSGPHLHIEFDRDTNYPCNTPTVKGSNILSGGISASVVNPAKLLSIGPGQELTKASNAYAEPCDIKLPVYVEDVSEPTGKIYTLDCPKLREQGFTEIRIKL